jgi:hypothetical protein
MNSPAVAGVDDPGPSMMITWYHQIFPAGITDAGYRT